MEYNRTGMQEAPQLREQLRSLSIPREQRPQPRATGRGGKSVPVVLALAVLVLGGYLAWQKYGEYLPWPQFAPAAAASTVRTLKVTAEPEPAPSPVLTATGKIVSDHRVEVATKVSGQITHLYFEQGDHVESGQIMAAIDDVLPRARRDEAKANLAGAQAHQAYQAVNFARIQSLFDQKKATDIEYADARRAIDESAAAVKAAEAQLAAAEKVLADCQVPAPISGVVLERNVEVGDFVAAEGGRGAMANSQFGAIADMTKLRVEVDVSELDIARLRSDMPCLIVPDAQKDRRYHGRVLWIDPGANYAKQTVQVKVRVDDPDDRLRVEGAAQVQFLPEPLASNAAPGLWVPQSACQVDPDGTTGVVYVRDAGRFQCVPVKLGRRIGERIEVLSGLSVGQEIATEGLDKLVALRS